MRPSEGQTGNAPLTPQQGGKATLREKASILIIDSDEGARRSLSHVFEENGYEVDTAQTAVEALEKVGTRSFRVALLAIGLPDMAGIDLVGPLRERQPDIIVILIAGDASLDTAVGALNDGACAYVIKPLDLQEVMMTVKQAMDEPPLIMKNRMLAQAAEREISNRKRAEEALHVTQKHFHHLVNASPSITYATSPRPDHVCHFVSENLFEVMGYPPKAMIDDPKFWISHVHPDDVSRVTGEVKQTLKKGGGTLEYRFQNARGDYRWIHDSRRVIGDEAGKPLEIVGSWTDITEHREAESTLEERLKFEKIVSTISTRFIDLPSREVDKEIEQGLKRIVEFLGLDWSSVLEFSEDKTELRVVHTQAVSGFSPMSTIHLQDEFPWYPERLRRGEIIRMSRPEALLDEAVKEKMYFLGEGLKANLTIPLTVGGSILFAISFGSFRSERSWPDELVNRLRLVGEIFANALARKQSEEALRTSQERVARIYRFANDGILIIDPEKEQIIEVNPRAAAMLEYAPEELAGARVSVIFRQETDQFSRLAAEVNKDEQSYTRETTFRTKSGAVIPVEISASAIQTGERFLMLAIVRDITERKRAESALRASEERHRVLYDDIPSMYFTVDPKGTILSVSRFGAQQLGYTRKELVGTSIIDLFHTEDKETAKQMLEKTLREPNRLHRWEIRKVRKHGTMIWMQETARVVKGADSQPTLLIVCEDITEARQLSEELSYQASHDVLTRLVNRREFENRLMRTLQSAREGKTKHALCYLDLDQFKVINDTCGHVAGDELLRQLGDVLKGHVRQRDTLARLGGDEFGVLMEHCSLTQASRVANALQKAIQDFRFIWKEKRFSIGVSIGLVPIDAASEGVASILRMADEACYAAKDGGRNRIHIYHHADTDLARRRGEMQWVSQINRALDEDRFHLVFQPIAPVITPNDGGDHYELLLRMEGHEGRLILPGAFLPAAERFNLSTKVDSWVIGKALEWLTSHPNHLDRLAVCSINLSGHSLGEDAFLEFVFGQFNKTRIPPSKICFEVTETAAIANLSSATRFITALKELGCLFALDDFGSGLSSFAYLKNLPVTYLKIDGSFVRNMVEDPIDFVMVSSINEIGQVMGKKTIAEFVETEAILQLLRDIGIDYAQGYSIGQPRLLTDMT
ncbi:MAG: EAL domain-containing protein [Gammaproteobacteria bacterium]|nr:EAL domain-containing protein [Gammaproteobacteria bacterium]MCI0591742.1 EAL domain-containing protein [Gammaproteobacteria bacterium]